MPTKSARITDSLSPEAFGYLKAIRFAADDLSATDTEAKVLHGLFLEVCARYGLDAQTMELAIEVLC